MTYFGTVKAALDALIAGICQHRGVSQPDALRMARLHLESMSQSQQWRNGQSPTIAYGDPLCRFSYLYYHTAVNANIFESFIRPHTETVQYMIDKLNQNEELKVCAFGGGPGTELLALVKLLKQPNQVARIQSQGNIDFTLLDNVPEWAESWNALETAIRFQFNTEYGPRRNWPFTMSKSFQPYDMTHVEQFANLSQFFTQDIYILNHVISEIVTNQVSIGNLINTMVTLAPSQARFIIVDRNQDGIPERSKALMESAGLTVVWHMDSSTYMDFDEQASELADYITGIGWRPRVQWNGAFCIVGVKA